MKSLQWFLDREGSYILRGTTEVFITNEETAKKLHALQSDKYIFTEKIRIHKARPIECESCSS